MNKTLSIILLLAFLSIQSSQAQENEWLIKPIITEKINRVIPELELIQVSNNKMFGVKNFRNEVIIPVDHSHVSVFLGVNYIAANKDKEKLYYDHEGYEIDESINAEVSRSKKVSSNKKKEKQKNKFNAETKNFQLHDRPDDKNKDEISSYYFTLLNLNGDTVIKNVHISDQIKLVGEDYIYSKKNKKACSKEGALLYEAESSYFSAYEKGEYIIVEDQRARKLFDKNFKQVGQDYESITIFENAPFYTYAIDRDAKEYFLADGIGNSDLVGKPVLNVGEILESDIFRLKFENHSGSYNTNTKEIKEYDFSVSMANKNSGVQVVKADTLYGTYDFITDKMIIPIQHASLGYKDPYYIAKEKRTLRSSKEPKNYTIYLEDGSTLFKETLQNIHVLSDGHFLAIDTTGASIIYDSNATAVLTSEEGQEIRATSYNDWISITEDGSSRHYFLSDYINGKETSFGRIGKSISRSTKGNLPLLLIYNKDGKVGAMTEDYKIVIPMEYDKIESAYIQNPLNEGQAYLKVTKDGKYGIMVRP